MNPSRLLLGELLVEARIITREQLDLVLELQKIDKRRLGALLVEKGFLSETQLTQILSQQLSVPWVSLHHVDFSRRLLALVPAEVAVKHCLIPIYVRHVRGQGDTLYVAMDDPTNEQAIAKCSTLSGLPTRAMIAAPRDIRQAVALYYNVDLNKIATAENRVNQPEPVAMPAGSDPSTALLSSVVQSFPHPGLDEEALSAPVISTEPASDFPEGAPALFETERALDSAPLIEPDFEEVSAMSEASTSIAQIPPGDGSVALAPGSSEQRAPRNPAFGDTDTTSTTDSTVHASREQTVASSESEGVEIEISRATTLDELRSRRRSAPESSLPPNSSPAPAERVMAMTLLDGTQIAVPVRTRREKVQRRALLNALVGSSAPVDTPPSDAARAATQSLGQMLRSLLERNGLSQEEDALVSQVTTEQLLTVIVRTLLSKGLLTEREILAHLRQH